MSMTSASGIEDLPGTEQGAAGSCGPASEAGV